MGGPQRLVLDLAPVILDIARHQPDVFAEVVVDPHQLLVLVGRLAGLCNPVLPSNAVGQGVEVVQQDRCVGINEAAGNHVVRKRIARVWIADLPLAREVAHPHGRRRCAGKECRPAHGRAAPLVLGDGREEEGLGLVGVVAAERDRPAEREPEMVLLERRGFRGEEIGGVHHVVPHEVVEVPVELLAAALDDDIPDASAVATRLCVEVARQELDLCDGLRRWEVVDAPLAAGVHVLNAVDRIAHLVRTRPVDREQRVALLADSALVGRLGGNPGRQSPELRPVAPVDGHLRDLNGVDHGRDLAALGVQDRSSARDLDGRCHFAHLQL